MHCEAGADSRCRSDRPWWCVGLGVRPNVPYATKNKVLDDRALQEALGIVHLEHACMYLGPRRHVARNVEEEGRMLREWSTLERMDA